MSHATSIPHLRQQGTATQLVVDDRPFLVIGGELHNSSSSSLEYMRPIWERLVGFHLNTALAAVFWELIEPVEGSFDFALVDGLITKAREHGLRLVLLWFGSWKNGVSSYIPEWVKRDYKRFPRVRREDGKAIEVLSTLSPASRDADAKAFAALMRHLREVDGDDHTVIMIQVENEVGVLGDSRDRCAAANEAFTGAAPQELFEHLRQHRNELHPPLLHRWQSTGMRTAGSWEEVFGRGHETDELFMAWSYARYIDAIAAAGKAEYALPMYVNAWLNGADQVPGNWPSGGPLPHVLDIWRAGAPTIDLLAPDIYQTNYEQWCRDYTRRGNPLFVPEMRRDEEGMRNVFMAVGAYDAIGVSPFAIDSLDPAAGGVLTRTYGVLEQLAPTLLEHQGKGEITGFVLDADHPTVTRTLGEYELQISLDKVFAYKAERGCGLIIATGADAYLGAGFGFCVSFRPRTPGPAQAGIATVDEGSYRDGVWTPLRRLNGDETWGGDYWRFPADTQSAAPLNGAYLVNAGTAISRCTVYRYE